MKKRETVTDSDTESLNVKWGWGERGGNFKFKGVALTVRTTSMR